MKKSLAATFTSVLPQALAAAKEKPWDDTAGLGARVVIQGSCTGSFSIPYALAAGDTTDMILEDYPNLQREDIAAALAFASDLQNLYRKCHGLSIRQGACHFWDKSPALEFLPKFLKGPFGNKLSFPKAGIHLAWH